MSVVIQHIGKIVTSAKIALVVHKNCFQKLATQHWTQAAYERLCHFFATQSAQMRDTQ